MNPNEANETPSVVAAARSARRSRLAEVGSFSALALSVLALATSAYQAKMMQAQTELMQTQSRASVWPYVAIGNDEDTTAGEETFSWHTENNGVGPARIESVQVLLDGKPYRNWREMYAALAPGKEFHARMSSLSGLVLPPSLNRETTVEMIKLTDHERARIFQAAVDRTLIEVCYCSIYDECWTATSRNPKKKPVPRCDTEGKPQFEQ